MVHKQWIFTLGIAFIVSSCANITGARPVFPIALNTDSETISLASIGKGQSGAFIVGPYSGNYKRSLTGKTTGLIVSKTRMKGKTRYALSGGDLTSSLNGDCLVTQAESSLGHFFAETEPFSLHCALDSQDGKIAATLDLDADPKGKAFRQDRVGFVRIRNDVIDIRSLHKKQTGGSTELALGYVFTRGGSPVAAVDVAGKPNVVLAKTLDQPTRQILLSAATGLALVWNPSF